MMMMMHFIVTVTMVMSWLVTGCFSRISLLSSNSFPHNIERKFMVNFTGNSLSQPIKLKIRNIYETVVFQTEINHYSKLPNNLFISEIETKQESRVIVLTLSFRRKASKHILELYINGNARIFREIINLRIQPKVSMKAHLLNNKYDELEVNCTSEGGSPPVVPVFQNLGQFRVVSNKNREINNKLIITVVLKLEKNDRRYLYCSADSVSKMFLVEGEDSSLIIVSNNIGVVSPNEMIQCKDPDGIQNRTIEIIWKVDQSPRNSENSYQINHKNGTFQFKDAQIGSVWQLSCSLFKDWYGKKRNVTKKINFIIGLNNPYNKLAMLENSLANSAAFLDNQLKKMEDNSKMLLQKITELKEENIELNKQNDLLKIELKTNSFGHVISSLGYYVWIVPNILTDTKTKYSPTIYARGYHFKIIVIPLGPTYKPGYISVFYELCKGDLDGGLVWPFPHKLSISILAGGLAGKNVLKTYTESTNDKNLESLERPKSCNIPYGSDDIMKLDFIRKKSNNVLDDSGSLYIKFMVH